MALLTLDPNKADRTGFLHGVRAVIRKFRAVLYNYPDKDGNPSHNEDGSEVKAPGFMVDFEVKTPEGPKTYSQFYANGTADQRIPDKKGRGFEAAPGSTVKSALNEGSNAYALIISLKACGWPTDQLVGDCSVFEGATVDLIAQPVATNSKRAKAEGQKTRTIAVVGKVVKFPDGVDGAQDEDDDDDDDAPPAKKSKAAVVDDDDDDGPAPAPKAKAKAAPADDDDDDDSDDDDDDSDDSAASDEAAEFVAQVLDSKTYRGKSVDLPTLAKEVLKLARSSKNRQAIVVMVQDPKFHQNGDFPWAYDKKTRTIAISE